MSLAVAVPIVFVSIVGSKFIKKVKGKMTKAMEHEEPRGPPLQAELEEGTKEWQLHLPQTEVDERDAKTADSWIARHPRMLRLTGKHPFNAEAPLDLLMQHGFITPVSLHYVRNHGPAPKLEWATHKINISGLVDRPMSITMDQLAALPTVTMPVTLVCAGNRRKEINMHKNSNGFHWGAAGLSTNYWTGVRLCDLLKHVGVLGPESGARHVCLRGPLAELPKGSDGSYGTSITYAKAMDPANDVLIAWQQNGRLLHPDHGYPVRLIVPGSIGGRMIKWLHEIKVTADESDNWYHFYDNRVLPSHLNAETAEAEGWWRTPDTIINDLNINSAISRPGHDEIIPLGKDLPYTMKGYAYTGGGRRLTRVEISMDEGATWKLAKINRFEEPNAYGKYWCWVFWELGVRTQDFAKASTVILRSWDDGMNTQPNTITWNIIGQMNNCNFIVKIHQHVDSEGNMGLRFQHPAPIDLGALGNVGWREEEAMKVAAAQPAAAAPVAPAGGAKTYTMAEVAVHNTEDSAWFVYENRVYDATPFLEEHPGGAESILLVAGMDATEDFKAIHSSAAIKMLDKYYIGDLVADKPAQVINLTATATAAAIAKSGELVALNPREKASFKLAERIELSHNSRLFRFALQSPEHRLGLPVGKHVFLYATINGETVMRAYTPSSSDTVKGHFDLVVKVYRAGENPAFPAGGKMSQHLDSLRIGDTIDAKGPVGHFTYEGRGHYRNGKVAGFAKQLNFVAGGTGITPCYQIIQAVCADPEDTTEVRLVYANQTEADILLRAELEALAAANPRFKLYHTLSKPPPAGGDVISATGAIDAFGAPNGTTAAAGGWTQGRGYVDEAMLRAHTLPPSAEALVGLCGPPGLLNSACLPNLDKIGWSKDSIVIF